MDQDRANAGQFRRLRRAQDRVLQQSPADALPGMAPIDRQPREKHDGDRMAAYSLRYPGGSARVVDGADGEAMEADDDLPLADDEGARGVGTLAGKRMAPEPQVERRDPAVEAVRVAGGPELFGRRDQLSQGALCCISFLRAGLVLAGRSRISLKAFHCAWSTRK